MKERVDKPGDIHEEKKKDYEEFMIQEPAIMEKLNELEVLRQSVEEKRAQAEEYCDQLLRLRAEFDNYRKRVQRNDSQLVSKAQGQIVLSILPGLEALEKAVEHIESNGADDKLAEGLKMALGQIHKALGEYGLKKIESMGQEFNYEVHHAVGMKEIDNAEQAGKVIEVVQDGYFLGENVLRPAMVLVGKKEKHDEINEEEEDGNNKGKDIRD